MKKKPPTDAFMGMLDLAWDDFKTYREKGDDSKPVGLAVVLIGQDREGLMTIKTGANIEPDWVEMALLQLTMGFATGALEIERVPVPVIKRKRVV
jgi:hypothetical protein